MREMGFSQGIMIEGMKQIFEDNRRTVTLYRATKTETNITGTEDLSYADAETVDIIFFKTDIKYEFGPEGLFEKGDCVIFDKPDNNNLSRDDKIVVDGETFMVRDIIAWKSRGEHIYDAMTGHKI